MPPKAKFTKQDFIDKATQIISTKGMEKLTARELATELGTSVRPIFTAFQNMEEVKQACVDFAMEKYHSYFKDGLGDSPFKQIGKMYIKFAINEPMLFQVLFLQSQSQTIPFDQYMKQMDDNYEDTLNLLIKDVNISADKAHIIYKAMWIFSTGIASLCATKQCSFTEQEIDELLDLNCTGIINQLNSN